MSAAVNNHDEVEQILCGDGRGDFVGISAIDGLTAAVVAGLIRLPPSAWLPMIFGGSRPFAPPGVVERRATDTILNRHDEVTASLDSRRGFTARCS